MPAAPRTDPYLQNYRIRLLPQVMTRMHCDELLGAFAYAFESLRRTYPALCPACGVPSSLPCGYPPSLHRLRRAACTLCSATSSVLWGYPTSHQRGWRDYGFPSPPRPTIPRRAPMRPPSSCSSSFPACSGSPTAWDRFMACDCRHVSFRFPLVCTTSASQIS